jgi:tripartite-type tricarboxylate transporter receptor subunit TctC
MRKRNLFTLGFATGVGLVLIIAILGTSFGVATAQKTIWPTKQVTIVVPTGPGGTVDRISRGMAPFLSKELGVNVIIENRPGGDSAVGTISHLKNDPDDGSFWLLESSPMFEVNSIRGAPFSLNDFDYIAVIHWDGFGIFVRKESPYKTLGQLFDAIKANPGKMKYACVPGSWDRVLMKIVGEEGLSSKTVDIPYLGGGGEVRTALLGGHVDFCALPFLGTMTSMGPDVRCLGVTKHQSSAPEIPLIINIARKYNPNLTFPEIVIFRHFDIKKPFKTKYPDRWNRMAEALKAVFNTPDFQDWNKKTRMDLNLMNPSDSARLVTEMEKLARKYADVLK